MNAVDFWESASNATPDYYHTCGWYGIPPTLVPPYPPADGEGCVGFFSADASIGESIQVCLVSPLDTAQEYIFSAYMGYNPNNPGSPNPVRLYVYGFNNGCIAPSFPGQGCPPVPGAELLASLTYNFSGVEGWTYGESACFKPNDFHDVIVITASCLGMTPGYTYIDKVELLTCQELLGVDYTVTPTCPGYQDGAIDLTVSGGTSPYTYDWDIDGIGDNDDDEDLNNLDTGFYQIIVTDALGRFRCMNIYVPEIPLRAIIFDPIDPICQGAPEIILPTSSLNTPPITGTWDPEKITTDTPGIYYFVFTPDSINCADPYTQVVEIIPTASDTGLISYFGCENDGYQQFVNGTIYNESNPSGIEILDFFTVCDSVVLIDFHYLPVSASTIDDTSCMGSGYSVIVNSTVYDESNPSGVVSLVNANNCDSNVTITLVFLDSVNTSISEEFCEGSGAEVIVNGNIYDESNPMGMQSLPAANGCDSIVQIALNFVPPPQYPFSYTGCEGDGYSIIINGTVYDEFNPTGVERIDNSPDCDSIIIIILDFSSQITRVENYFGCFGDGYSITVNNVIYDELNPTGTETLVSSRGCDSVITIDLVFDDQINTAENYNGCRGDGYSVTVNNVVYNESNPTGMETLVSRSGCDSVITIDLIFDDQINTTENYNGCRGDGYSITVNNVVYDESNPTGTVTLVSSNGCDSVITIDLVYNDQINTTENYNGCRGDGYSITVNNVVYNESNPTGTETLVSGNGCDSIISINLVFDDQINTTENYSGCIGDGYSITVNNVVYDESNPTGTVTLVSSNGCDSVITVNLIFDDQINTTENYNGCIGDGYSITINNVVYNESNPTGTETLISNSGCDSIISIDLVFNDQINTTENYSGCIGDGYSITVNSVVYNESNPTGTETLVSSGGCDSVITIDLVFDDQINTTENYSGCIGDGYSITVNNVVYDESNPTGTETLISNSGCDSIISIDLVFDDQINITENYSGCLGDGYSITVNNVVYNESNPTGTETLISSSGCDSVVSIDLVYLPTIEREIIYEGCENDAYFIEVNGNRYDEFNPIGVEIISGGGDCDTSVSIDLRFHQSTVENRDIHVVSSMNYPIDIINLFPTVDSITLIDVRPTDFVSCGECPLPIFSSIVNQVINISVVDEYNCTHSATLNFILESDQSVFVPTVFSPNDDGINDVFRPYAAQNSDLVISSFEIYDRWGKRVFSRESVQINSELSGWDGTTNGKACSAGVYVYVLTIQDGENQVKRFYGQIHLVN